MFDRIGRLEAEGKDGPGVLFSRIGLVSCNIKWFVQFSSALEQFETISS